MKKNVGGFDKIGRIAIAVGLIGLAATGNIGAWGFLGAIPLLTGISGYCPVYLVFGISTSTIQAKKLK